MSEAIKIMDKAQTTNSDDDDPNTRLAPRRQVISSVATPRVEDTEN